MRMVYTVSSEVASQQNQIAIKGDVRKEETHVARLPANAD